jgi:hypothetical protein
MATLMKNILFPPATCPAGQPDYRKLSAPPLFRNDDLPFDRQMIEK